MLSLVCCEYPSVQGLLLTCLPTYNSPLKYYAQSWTPLGQSHSSSHQQFWVSTLFHLSTPPTLLSLLLTHPPPPLYCPHCLHPPWHTSLPTDYVTTSHGPVRQSITSSLNSWCVIVTSGTTLTAAHAARAASGSSGSQRPASRPRIDVTLRSVTSHGQGWLDAGCWRHTVCRRTGSLFWRHSCDVPVHCADGVEPITLWGLYVEHLF